MRATLQALVRQNLSQSASFQLIQIHGSLMESSSSLVGVWDKVRQTAGCQGAGGWGLLCQLEIMIKKKHWPPCLSHLGSKKASTPGRWRCPCLLSRGPCPHLCGKERHCRSFDTLLKKSPFIDLGATGDPHTETANMVNGTPSTCWGRAALGRGAATVGAGGKGLIRFGWVSNLGLDRGCGGAPTPFTTKFVHSSMTPSTSEWTTHWWVCTRLATTESGSGELCGYNTKVASHCDNQPHVIYHTLVCSDIRNTGG